MPRPARETRDGQTRNFHEKHRKKHPPARNSGTERYPKQIFLVFWGVFGGYLLGSSTSGRLFLSVFCMEFRGSLWQAGGVLNCNRFTLKPKGETQLVHGRALLLLCFFLAPSLPNLSCKAFTSVLKVPLRWGGELLIERFRGGEVAGLKANPRAHSQQGEAHRRVWWYAIANRQSWRISPRGLRSLYPDQLGLVLFGYAM